jgi:hypothetical protein
MNQRVKDLSKKSFSDLNKLSTEELNYIFKDDNYIENLLLNKLKKHGCFAIDIKDKPSYVDDTVFYHPVSFEQPSTGENPPIFKIDPQKLSYKLHSYHYIISEPTIENFCYNTHAAIYNLYSYFNKHLYFGTELNKGIVSNVEPYPFSYYSGEGLLEFIALTAEEFREENVMSPDSFITLLASGSVLSDIKKRLQIDLKIASVESFLWDHNIMVIDTNSSKMDSRYINRIDFINPKGITFVQKVLPSVRSTALEDMIDGKSVMRMLVGYDSVEVVKNNRYKPVMSFIKKG